MYFLLCLTLYLTMCFVRFDYYYYFYTCKENHLHIHHTFQLINVLKCITILTLNSLFQINIISIIDTIDTIDVINISFHNPYHGQIREMEDHRGSSRYQQPPLQG